MDIQFESEVYSKLQEAEQEAELTDARYSSGDIRKAVCEAIGKDCHFRTKSGNDLIHDPVEETAEYKAVVAEVDKEARAAVESRIKRLIDKDGDEDFIRSLPTSHRFAFEKKRILKECYGIEWKSVIELNPNVLFD